MRIEDVSPRIQYIRNLFAPEDDILSKATDNLDPQRAIIQIGAEEGKLLQVLARMNNVQTIVELGTLVGYSTIWLARALPENGQVYTIEGNPDHYQLAQNNFQKAGLQNKITSLLGRADKVLEELAEKAPFDMIFIDADKISYSKYLTWAEKNLKKNGLIVADNTFLSEAVYLDKIPENIRVKPSTHAAMKEFNKRLANPDKYDSIMIPTAVGLTIAIKKT
jgi:predicted O-methyltransferase YrrM